MEARADGRAAACVQGRCDVRSHGGAPAALSCPGAPQPDAPHAAARRAAAQPQAVGGRRGRHGLLGGAVDRDGVARRRDSGAAVPRRARRGDRAGAAGPGGDQGPPLDPPDRHPPVAGRAGSSAARPAPPPGGVRGHPQRCPARPYLGRAEAEPAGLRLAGRADGRRPRRDERGRGVRRAGGRAWGAPRRARPGRGEPDQRPVRAGGPLPAAPGPAAGCGRPAGVPGRRVRVPARVPAGARPGSSRLSPAPGTCRRTTPQRIPTPRWAPTRPGPAWMPTRPGPAWMRGSRGRLAVRPRWPDHVGPGGDRGRRNNGHRGHSRPVAWPPWPSRPAA